MSSEFGKGFIYNLILFAKHFERLQKQLETYQDMRGKMSNEEKANGRLFTDGRAIEMWFNGAADHLFELKIPKSLKGTNIGKLAEKLQNRGLSFRLMSFNGRQLTTEDFHDFFKDLERLTRMIDREVFKLRPVKADFN